MKPTLSEILHRKGIAQYDAEAVDFIVEDNDDRLVIRRYKINERLDTGDYQTFLLPPDYLKGEDYEEDSEVAIVIQFDTASHEWIRYPVAHKRDRGRSSIFEHI